MCWCCGKEINKDEAMQVNVTWEGRLNGYCYECASSRCDAFPQDCPRDPVNQLNRRRPRVRTANLATADS